MASVHANHNGVHSGTTTMRDPDTSMPREMAERRLRVKPGTLGLDDLAQRLSIEHYPEEPVTVRDITTKPIAHSQIYFRGEVQPGTPYLIRTTRGIA